MNRVRNILPVGTTSGNAVPFVRQVAPTAPDTPGAAAMTNMGALKGKVSKNIERASAPVEKVTAFAKVPTELLDDIPALSSFLSFVLINDLLDVEDTQLIMGNGTPPSLTGLSIGALNSTDLLLTTTTPNNWDAIVAAKAALAGNNYRPNVVLMNPVDMYAMAISKGENGQYVAPIFVQDGFPTLWGQSIYETTAIPVGSFMVMDGSKAAQLFQRSPINVRFFEQDDTNVQYNLVTVVAEERLALPIFYPEAVYYDSFADTIAAIAVS
jgi:HK97 family phage major capsid protein